MPIFVLVLIAGGIAWWWYRSNELFYVSVRQGRAILVRGRIPGLLLNDFRDAIADIEVSHATIRAFRAQGGAKLAVSGAIDEHLEQRLRNIFHLYPISRLEAASSPEARNWGQVLGIVWLAWLLDRSLRRDGL